ncbi:MarR family transcriptional regulator [Glaciihabitans sp. UYNi722]|uniref:MarR family winged helix-turn-helix transcriptional regulator n=1 Tax=Glaciihabitans sp. UYNi722 TaxID=3156344 RepID=UPI00339772C3
MSIDDDEVDLLIDAWAQRLPDVDFAPLDVMSRLRRVSHRLNRLRGDAFRSVDLSIWEFDVLAALRRADPPHELNPAELMRATMIGSGAMSNRLENLTTRGLIERRPNPSDGRSTLACLTQEGLARVDAAMIALVSAEAEELRSLSKQERSQLVHLLRRLGAADSSSQEGS